MMAATMGRNYTMVMACPSILIVVSIAVGAALALVV
jgi:hypothetical protein